MASTFTIDDVLTNIGVVVKVGQTEIVWAHNYSPLGADKNMNDITPLSSAVRLQTAGLIEQDTWELNYYYNRADFTTIETAKSGGTSIALEVDFKNGDKFTNTGVCINNYVDGGASGDNADCKAQFTLNGEWTRVEGH